MRSKVSSDWLPSYIKVTRPVLEIFKMDGYFPDSPRMLEFIERFLIISHVELISLKTPNLTRSTQMLGEVGELRRWVNLQGGLFYRREIICGTIRKGARGGVVFKALRYKPAGRGFDGVIGIFQ
jgi:hypothetical protein